MPDQTPETVQHFAVVRFNEAFYALPKGERQSRTVSWITSLRKASDYVHLYQLRGFDSEGDLLVWSACKSSEPTQLAHFFKSWAAAESEMAGLISVTEVRWGFTHPSQYTKSRSAQEIEPFGEDRMPFLVAYPFVKTADWYQLDMIQRRELMADHIRVGMQYKDIHQLLLYSFGVQDQEFVVVYETQDLRRFSALVQELRGTAARPYTERDAPLRTGRYLATTEDVLEWL